MSKTTTIIGIIALIVVVVVVTWPKRAADKAITPIQVTQQNNVPPTFTWSFKNSDLLNPDGLPQNNVFLKVTYANGTIQNKFIATTDGSCNDLPDADKDSVPNSTTIQCYSAGLGYRFKIIKGEKSYLVQEKTFEEALPNKKPSSYQYTTVAEFPLTQ